MINPSTSYTIPFVTMAAGVPTNAASTPTAVVWRNGSAEATSVTVSTTSNTGIYHAAFTTGSGWSKTDRIWLVVSATISSVAYRGIVWDSFSEPDAVMRGTDGANTTTPPTAASIADTTLSSATSGPSTGGNWPNGSIGRMVLIGASTQREVAVTGANHVAADVHEFQPAVITSGDFATDAISADAVSSGAVTKLVTGVWSALTSGLSVVGSTGRALARLIGLVQDVGGDRFTAKALEEAPTGAGGGTVNVLPAVGISAERNAGVVLNPFVGETISQAIALYQTDGVTPIDLSGKTLELVFDTRSGADVAVVANGDITVSGNDDNIITFSYPAAVTASERVLRVALRDATAPRTVYLSGLCKVSLAPFND